MLWYKSWLETRWRFLIGLAILAVSACGTVLVYPQVEKLVPLARQVSPDTVVGRAINEAIAVERDYRGYIWWQWFHQNLIQMWTLFAALLGSGSLPGSDAGAALFTLSLPATRNRLLATRAATGFGELAALAVVPSLLVPLLSTLVGQRYSAADLFVHIVCLLVAGAVFFSLASLLSTVFDDLWRPLLLTCGIAVALALPEQFVPPLGRFGIFHVMNGAVYFRTGHWPWAGLLVSAAASAAMWYAAAVNIARRDF